jgi:hypothetical protein
VIDDYEKFCYKATLGLVNGMEYLKNKTSLFIDLFKMKFPVFVFMLKFNIGLIIKFLTVCKEAYCYLIVDVIAEYIIVTIDMGLDIIELPFSFCSYLYFDCYEPAIINFS